MPDLPVAPAWQYLLLAGCLLAALPVVPSMAAQPSEQRQQELFNLLHQDCGSCHGMRLTGGLGPALTPAALDGKPRELLVATIRDGRTGTPMPPWRTMLSDAEIAWLVDTLTRPGATP